MKMWIPTNEEYDRLLVTAGEDDSKMHWSRMYTWVKNGMPQQNPAPEARALRGFFSARHWGNDYAAWQGVDVGFRPAVELCETGALASDIQEGDSCVIGTLYMDGLPVKVPTNPTGTGDVSAYFPGAKLEMREAMDDPEYQVTGFRVGNALIADRVLLNMISYEDIEAAIADSEKDNAQPVAENTEMTAVAGVKTKGGLSVKMRIPTNEEFDRLVDLTDGSDSKMHWKDMPSWVNDVGAEHCVPSDCRTCRTVRGWVSARSWCSRNATNRYVYVGFRPAVELCETGSLGSDIQEGESCVIGTLYMDGLPVRVPTNPTETGDVSAYFPGAKLEMREAMDDPQYQVTGFRIGDAFIADRVLLNMISYEDIEAALAHEPDCENTEIPAAMSVDTPLGTIVVKTATDSEHPGVYIDLRRKGCECDMPLALVEYCGDEGDKPDGEKNIITRVWGDAAQEDYTDRVVHEGIEDYFAPEQPDEYVVLAAPGIAVQMLSELDAMKECHFGQLQWLIAQGRGCPTKRVLISLSEGHNGLPSSTQPCYIIRLLDYVKPRNSKTYHTEDRTEESLVKLLKEILDGLK